jgi:hypothetical protein
MIEKRDSQKTKASGGKNKKSKDKKSKEKDKDKPSDSDGAMELDYTYLDDHHKAVLAALVLSPDIVLGGSRPTNTNTSTNKPSASSSAPSSSNSQGQGEGQGARLPTGLIVGLGGGAMPMCMQRYLPGMRLSTCEMDPDMHTIAVKFFAFRSGRLHYIHFAALLWLQGIPFVFLI